MCFLFCVDLCSLLCIVSDHLPNDVCLYCVGKVNIGDHLPRMVWEVLARDIWRVQQVSVRRCRELQSILRWSIVGCYRSTSTSRPGSVEERTGSGESPQGKEVKVAVSSLRADTVAAAGLDISKKCVALIEHVPSVCVCVCVHVCVYICMQHMH